MLRKTCCVVAAVAAAWGSCAAAAPTGTSDLNAALFGLRPSAIGVDLSPSGNEVAYVTPAPGGEAVAFIANVQTGDAKPFLKSGKGPEKLRWCAFVTEQRLVCRYGGVIDQSGMLIPFSRLIAVNSDGSGMKELGQSQSYYDAGYRQYDGDIIDWLPGAGGSVLMQRSYIPEAGHGGTRMVRRTDGLVSIGSIPTRSRSRSSKGRGATRAST